MAHPPRRPVNPLSAAEAAFRPKPVAAPAPTTSAIPGARELVSLRIDQSVLEHFQNDGPGWQDRINDVLRGIVAKTSG